MYFAAGEVASEWKGLNKLLLKRNLETDTKSILNTK